MIMRITWGKVHPGTWDEYERAYQSTVVEQSGNVEGLRARWLVQDRDDRDAGYAVSMWESQEHLQAYRDSDFFRQIQDALQPYFIGEFQTTQCDVKVVENFA